MNCVMMFNNLYVMNDKMLRRIKEEEEKMVNVIMDRKSHWIGHYVRCLVFEALEGLVNGRWEWFQMIDGFLEKGM